MGYLSQSGLQLDYRFTFFPHVYDFAALAHCADTPKLYALLVQENAPLFAVFVLQFSQVLDQSIDVDTLERFILLKQTLHLPHLLIKHCEELRRFFNLYTLLSQFTLGLS